MHFLLSDANSKACFGWRLELKCILIPAGNSVSGAFNIICRHHGAAINMQEAFGNSEGGGMSEMGSCADVSSEKIKWKMIWRESQKNTSLVSKSWWIEEDIACCLVKSSRSWIDLNKTCSESTLKKKKTMSYSTFKPRPKEYDTSVIQIKWIMSKSQQYVTDTITCKATENIPCLNTPEQADECSAIDRRHRASVGISWEDGIFLMWQCEKTTRGCQQKAIHWWMKLQHPHQGEEKMPLGYTIKAVILSYLGKRHQQWWRQGWKTWCVMMHKISLNEPGAVQLGGLFCK